MRQSTSSVPVMEKSDFEMLQPRCIPIVPAQARAEGNDDAEQALSKVDHGKRVQWANKMARRGWTPDQISEAIAHGGQFAATNNVNSGNKAIRYVHPTTGRSVIVDSVTAEVIHVGGDGFLY